MDAIDLPALTLVLLVLVAFAAGWVDAVVGGGGLIQLPALLIGLSLLTLRRYGQPALATPDPLPEEAR